MANYYKTSTSRAVDENGQIFTPPNELNSKFIMSKVKDIKKMRREIFN